MAGRQVRHGKVLAGAAHGFSEAAAGDFADPVEVAVDKQHGLAQAAAVGRSVSVGDVGSVVQVPGIGRAETVSVERFDQGVKVGGWPERGTGRCRRGPMRRTKPTSIARD